MDCYPVGVSNKHCLLSLFSFLQGMFVLKLTGIANFVNANPCKAFSLSF